MKRKINYVVAVCALACALLNPLAASAGETVRIDCETLPTTDTWIDGTLNVNEFHYYPIEVLTVGKLTIRVQSFFDYCRADILDEDLVSFAVKQYLNGSAGAPATVDFTYYVEPGTYYVRCTGEAGHEGSYRIKALFDEIESTESEPNDDYTTAYPLQKGIEIYGVHTREDAHDFYTFEVEQGQEVKLTVSVADSFKTHLKVYDSDLQLLDEIYDGVAFAEAKTYTYQKSLDAGVYYIDMNTIYTDEGAGPYWIRLGEKTASQQTESTESDKSSPVS